MTPIADQTSRYPPMNAMVERAPSPRWRATARCANTIGATVGSIMAAIIVTHIVRKRLALMLPWTRLPIWPSPMTMPLIEFACSIVLCHANSDSATNATTTTRLMRHVRRVNAARGVSSSRVMAATGKRSVGAAPGERNVLARLSAAVPCEAESVDAVHFCRSPCRNGVGADFGARGIYGLDALPRQCCRAGQRVGLRFDFARYRGAPRGEVARHIEFDRREVDAAQLADFLCELPGPTSDPAAENHLQRVTLPGVGALVDE